VVVEVHLMVLQLHQDLSQVERAEQVVEEMLKVVFHLGQRRLLLEQ
jgi:hypothetical protein